MQAQLHELLLSIAGLLWRLFRAYVQHTGWIARAQQLASNRRTKKHTRGENCAVVLLIACP